MDNSAPTASRPKSIYKSGKAVLISEATSMSLPEEPFNEASRLQELLDLQLLDTMAEPAFDNLAQLASGICETPVALISLIDRDRVWFKLRVGFDDSQAPRTHSFCSHVVEGVTPLIVVKRTEVDTFVLVKV
ncbi:MAG: hypothetical protein H7337_00940 [Rhizobacter sp.]|nr:hypothetical protein [Rhizobacter sp.]